MAWTPRSGSFTYRRRSGSAGTRSGARTDLAIRTEGLGELRRGLKQIAPEANEQFTKELKGVATNIANIARRRTPQKSGRLASKIKPSVTQREMAIYIPSQGKGGVPYARLQEWGSSGLPSSQVQPKGVPIKVRGSQMLGKAVYSQRDTIVRHVQWAFERVAKQNGFDD